jgi:hypothetical protein
LRRIKSQQREELTQEGRGCAAALATERAKRKIFLGSVTSTQRPTLSHADKVNPEPERPSIRKKQMSEATENKQIQAPQKLPGRLRYECCADGCTNQAEEGVIRLGQKSVQQRWMHQQKSERRAVHQIGKQKTMQEPHGCTNQVSYDEPEHRGKAKFKQC